ncbi:hypothetical protein [Pseudoalteromonas luteoviolacea]|uniref:hypothetical protein n=1 Tax=Pseudoalteromonas luteoviolacea TaxID=43657 RepID=UPI00114F6DD5|nr:hypothetical protein [Pseudoalteromonas luteoviolacea]TQF67879.1 hypothetical protein FLM44_22120 [Pseudoalteromonas luteoviolacea]
MNTKKLMVAFNPKKPNFKYSDFLLPIVVDGEAKLLGLSSGKYFEYGMVIMAGKEVSVNDIFAKLVDLGTKIDDVDATLVNISQYVNMLKGFKISNVLKVKSSHSNTSGFSLEKANVKPSNPKKGLP